MTLNLTTFFALLGGLLVLVAAFRASGAAEPVAASAVESKAIPVETSPATESSES
jgi:hypothetical protein